jgi:hypothetical protein
VRDRPASDVSLEYASAQFALAQWALARGDTAGVERRQRAVRTTGNLVLAELWERSGEPERSLRAANRRDTQFAYAMFASERFRRVARLERQLGRRDEEREALRALVDLRQTAEPHLQPEVARARARLAELDAQSER